MIPLAFGKSLVPAFGIALLMICGATGSARAEDTLFTTPVSNFGTVSMVFNCRALNVGAKPTDITIQLLDATFGGIVTTPRLCAATPPGVNCVDFAYIPAPNVANVFCKIETKGRGEHIRGSLSARQYGTDELLAIVEAR